MAATTRWRRGWVILLTMSGTVGCGSDTVADAAPLGPVLSVSDVGPRIAVGQQGTVGPYDFGEVVDAARLSDGRIAVADRMNSTIHVFDSLGAPLRTIGRSGEGPGEFDVLTDIAPGRDGTVLAWDARLQRATVFDSDGQVVEEANLRRAQLAGYRLRAWDERRGRLWLTRASVLPPRGEVRAVGQYRVALAELSDATADSVVTLDYMEAVRLQALPENRGGLVAPVPLAPVGLLAATSDLLFYTNSRTPEIEIYGTNGRLRRTVILDLPIRPPRPDEIGAWEESVRRQYGEAPGAQRYIEVVRDEAGIAKTVAPFTSALPDPSGNAWFRLRDGGRWVGVSSEGTILGQLELPEEASIIRMGQGFVILRLLDDLGRATVEVRRISIG